jgi:hypothetical protein
MSMDDQQSGRIHQLLEEASTTQLGQEVYHEIRREGPGKGNDA